MHRDALRWCRRVRFISGIGLGLHWAWIDFHRSGALTSPSGPWDWETHLGTVGLRRRLGYCRSCFQRLLQNGALRRGQAAGRPRRTPGTPRRSATWSPGRAVGPGRRRSSRRTDGPRRRPSRLSGSAPRGSSGSPPRAAGAGTARRTAGPSRRAPRGRRRSRPPRRAPGRRHPRRGHQRRRRRSGTTTARLAAAAPSLGIPSRNLNSLPQIPRQPDSTVRSLVGSTSNPYISVTFLVLLSLHPLLLLRVFTHVIDTFTITSLV